MVRVRSRVSLGGDEPRWWLWVLQLVPAPVLVLAAARLRLSTCCSPSHPSPLQVPALGFVAGTERAHGVLRRWLKKEQNPPNK